MCRCKIDFRGEVVFGVYLLSCVGYNWNSMDNGGRVRGILGVGGNDIFGGTEFFALHNGKWEYTVVLGAAVWAGFV